MKQIEALQRLKRLGDNGFETRDAAALLGVTRANAHMILRRLERGGLLTHVTHGRWLSGRETHRFNLPELISAPSPSYVSLQSALFHHGLIEQIPSVIYAVTLGRPRRVTTPLGTVSFHRVPPDLFEGFEITAENAKVATAEKALFDLLYLSPSRSRLFARLPEIQLPRRFQWAVLRRYAGRVKSQSRRTLLLASIEQLKSATMPE